MRVAGSIPALNKYLYNLQVVVPGLAVCACDISVCTHHAGIILSKAVSIEL